MSQQTYAIVGAGLAGASAAIAIRNAGFDGRIVVLGQETEEPYKRPPLSKTLLRGETARDRIAVRQADFYTGKSIEVITDDAVASIDSTARRIETAHGQNVLYDKLLLAMGATPQRMSVPGNDLVGVYYLRTVDDCEAIRSELGTKPRVVVVGSGFIGCEVAASLRTVGCEVALIGRKLPLEHVLGHEIGEHYAKYHRDHGVDVRTDSSVSEFRGAKRVEQAILSDGTTIACDAAVVGIGVTPSLQVVPKDVHTDNGVVTDEFCRTNLDNVWAAGDVASSWRPRLNRRVRFEHFDNAQRQGTAAGKNMAGTPEAYDPVPYFWSDQFDLSLQYYGYSTNWDDCVIRGSVDKSSFAAFFVRDDRIEAVCLINRPNELPAARQLLEKRGISASALRDEGTDLSQLGA